MGQRRSSKGRKHHEEGFYKVAWLEAVQCLANQYIVVHVLRRPAIS